MIVQHILLIKCSVKGLIFFVQLFKRTNLGQGIFSLEIFYLFLRRNLTKFGHNLLSLLRNTSSELKLKCCQAMFLKQCMWLSENIQNAFKTIINFNHVKPWEVQFENLNSISIENLNFSVDLRQWSYTHHIGWSHTFQASAISSPIS